MLGQHDVLDGMWDVADHRPGGSDRHVVPTRRQSVRYAVRELLSTHVDERVV